MIFVKYLFQNKTVDKSHSARVLIGCKPIKLQMVTQLEHDRGNKSFILKKSFYFFFYFFYFFIFFIFFLFLFFFKKSLLFFFQFVVGVSTGFQNLVHPSGFFD